MLRVKSGAVLRGLPREKRHDYSWDLGKGIGTVCSRCGEPRPPISVDETPCQGRHVVLVDGLRDARAAAILPAWLFMAWERLREVSVEVGPAHWQAARVSFRACFVRLGRETGQGQAKQALADARDSFQAVGQGVPPRLHAAASCRAIGKVAIDGHGDPLQQAVLMAAAMLEEFEANGDLPPEAEVTRHASTMILRARALGYFV